MGDDDDRYFRDGHHFRFFVNTDLSRINFSSLSRLHIQFFPIACGTCSKLKRKVQLIMLRVMVRSDAPNHRRDTLD